MESFKIVIAIMIFSIPAVFIPHSAYADENLSETFDSKAAQLAESGFITGFGSGNIDEGDYQPVLFIWHLAIGLNQYFSVPEHSKGKITFYMEPQINPVLNPETDIECGIGLG